jgi:UDP-N-acetylmuramate dehydrogenase
MSAYEKLAASLERAGLEVRRNEPLARHTTFGIGGPADLFVVARSAGDLRRVVAAARDAGAAWFVLGSGSNILVGDGGIRGVTVANEARRVSEPEDLGAGRVSVTAEAGASFAALARTMARRGFGGLEWASGIPGTVGGAVVYNAGAYGGCLADALREVTLVNGSDRARRVPAGDLGLVYRGSAFTRGVFRDTAVLEATLVLWQADAGSLERRIAELDAKRLAAQPRGRNAGSIFKNPPERPAWKLIDAAGLRGHRVGDAQISEKHCNFFVNLGHARAADVYALIRLAQERVRQAFGVELELEVTLVGEGFDG